MERLFWRWHSQTAYGDQTIIAICFLALKIVYRINSLEMETFIFIFKECFV